MDFHLKQWRNQHESEQQPSAKIPKLVETHHHQQPSGSALPLFVPEPTSKIGSLSAFPDSTTGAIRFPRMGSYFSWSQWQELELQALIFRYMLAGAPVPPELLQPIKKSLLHAPPYFLHHTLQHYSHYQPALLQSWGRSAMDPEPGRCRRTDGKKWRCSRDVVAGQKYCERHMHRGRNRSRKPVEVPAPTGSATLKTTIPVSSASHFDLSGPSPSIDLLHLSHRGEDKGVLESQNEVENRSDGHTLRRFFDDWPRSVQESDNGGSNGSPMSSASCLSIYSSSDVSLKLATGNGHDKDDERDHRQLNWGAAWTANPVASMGGPLAEALRSATATSNASPTSVLHHLPRSSASETSFVTT